MKFEDIINSNNIYLYFGDLPIQRREYTKKNFIGLSITRERTNGGINTTFNTMLQYLYH